MSIHADEQGDPYCIAPHIAEELLSQAPWQRLVVMGDAFAREAGEPRPGYADGPWADRVAAVLRSTHPDLAYLNLAKGQVSAAEIRSRQLGKALAFQPGLVVIAAGCGCTLRDSFDADVTEAELARIIVPLRDAGAEVLVVVPFGGVRAARVPGTHRDGPRRQLKLLAERVSSLALRSGAIHVDLSAHPADADPGIYGEDGRRINARGHAIVTAAAVRRLGVHLGTIAQPSLGLD
jgi:hypothetical protein